MDREPRGAKPFAHLFVERFDTIRSRDIFHTLFVLFN